MIICSLEIERKVRVVFMGRKIKPVLTHGTITILGTSNLTCNAVPVPVGPYRIHIRVRIRILCICGWRILNSTGL